MKKKKQQQCCPFKWNNGLRCRHIYLTSACRSAWVRARRDDPRNPELGKYNPNLNKQFTNAWKAKHGIFLNCLIICSPLKHVQLFKENDLNNCIRVGYSVHHWNNVDCVPFRLDLNTSVCALSPGYKRTHSLPLENKEGHNVYVHISNSADWMNTSTTPVTIMIGYMWMNATLWGWPTWESSRAKAGSSWSTSKQIWEVEMERVPLTSSSGQTSRAGLLSTTGPETHELGSDGAPVRGGIMMI